MKRLALPVAVLALAVPAPALAFHHGGLPATTCAADAAGSPSNDNGNAKEALITHNKHFPPALPPVGTPGAGRGEGEHHCANR